MADKNRYFSKDYVEALAKKFSADKALIQTIPSITLITLATPHEGSHIGNADGPSYNQNHHNALYFMRTWLLKDLNCSIMKPETLTARLKKFVVFGGRTQYGSPSLLIQFLSGDNREVIESTAIGIDLTIEEGLTPKNQPIGNSLRVDEHSDEGVDMKLNEMSYDQDFWCPKKEAYSQGIASQDLPFFGLVGPSFDFGVHNFDYSPTLDTDNDKLSMMSESLSDKAKQPYPWYRKAGSKAVDASRFFVA